MVSLTYRFIYWAIISTVFHMNSTLATSNWHCGDQCLPGNATEATQCSYIKTCCSDTLGDVLINYLTLQYCVFNTLQPLGVAVLCIFVLYAFIILGSIADDYFAPTMEELAELLGVSHELAGVTFVALGNGAPDISSSVAAITQGGDTTKLGLGALLGAAVFDTIAVSGVIALVVNNPQVARRPFLRDCFFLFVAASCVLFITNDGKVVFGEAIGMIVIYIFYVCSVLLGEIYKKLRTKKHRETIERRKTTTEPAPSDLTDKILPVLSAFSNDSMRDLYAAKMVKPSINQLTPVLQCVDDEPTELLLLNPEVPHVRTLYHSLEKDRSRRSQYSTRHTVSDSTSLEDVSYALSDKDIDEDKPLWKVFLLYFVRGPTLLIDILCKISIPLTDKHWNDWDAIMSCTTAPIFIQFAFLPNTMGGLIGNTIPIVAVVGVIGFILSLFTYWRVQMKYTNANANEKQMLDEPLLGNTKEQDQATVHPVVNSMGSLVGGGTTDNQSDCVQDSGGSLLGSPQINNNNISNMETLSEYQGMHELLNVKTKKEKNKMKKEPVMKLFFLFLGFLSAVAWIKVVAEELVNLLTTLGVISTIDLALLGLTVLAWGNSIGDMIADVSVSRRGYAKMGISAAIGGPTLNVLIGVGLGTIIETCSSNGEMIMPNTSNIFVCCVAVMSGIAIYATWTAINRWTLNRAFGYFCFVYYLGFLVINVLVYKQVIYLPFGS